MKIYYQEKKREDSSWEKIFAKQIFDNLYLEYTELLWLSSKTTFKNELNISTDVSPNKDGKLALKRASISVFIITTTGYHYSLRWLRFQKTNYTKYWLLRQRSEILTHCWWKYKMLQPLWKTGWKFLINLNILNLPCDLQNLTPRYLLKT